MQPLFPLHCSIQRSHRLSQALSCKAWKRSRQSAFPLPQRWSQPWQASLRFRFQNISFPRHHQSHAKRLVHLIHRRHLLHRLRPHQFLNTPPYRRPPPRLPFALHDAPQDPSRRFPPAQPRPHLLHLQRLPYLLRHRLSRRHPHTTFHLPRYHMLHSEHLSTRCRDGGEDSSQGNGTSRPS